MPAAVTRYVNTASTGGNGTTNATSGANAAYATLAAWNTAEAKNLVTADEAHTVYCTGGSDGSAVDLASWTTDTTRTITITSTDVRSSTTFADGYRLSQTGDILSIAKNVAISNIRLELINSSSSAACAYVTSGANVTFDQVWFRKSVAGGSFFGIYTNGGTIVLRNCIIDNSVAIGGSGIYTSYGTGTVSFYNCTLTSLAAALNKDGSSNTLTVKNCALFNNTTDLVGDGTGGNLTVQYTASDDTISGTGNVDISPGGTEATDWANAFMDYANGDYRVKNTSSVLYNAGTDLSGSGVTVDFAGTARPQATTYDIGAFEYLYSAPALAYPPGHAVF